MLAFAPATVPISADVHDINASFLTHWYSAKINRDVLNDAVRTIIDEVSQRKRRFVETVELQVAFKKTFGSRRLPLLPYKLNHPTKHNFKVCVLGDQQRCGEARANNIDCLDLEGLVNKKKKPAAIKRLVKRYDAFLVPKTMANDVMKLIGYRLKMASKFPLPIENQDSLMEKVQEAKCTVRFNMKKALWVAVAVANVAMPANEIATNIDQAVAVLLSLLKSDWPRIKSMHTKATMGPAHRIY